jgi:protocatechuate 3,4-dioxygenase beta subunit
MATGSYAQSFTLSGTVYGGSSPLANALVEALQDGTTSVAASSTTNTSGQYSMALASGTYDLRVTPPSGSGFGQETVQDIAISGADRTYDVVLLSSRVGSISGVIRGRNGQPVPNAYVRVSGGSSSASTYTDSQGQYTLQAASGTAHLQVYGSGPAGVAPSNFSAERYNIAVNGPTTVDLDLPVVTLTGRVLDPNGNGVAGASLSLSSYQSVTGGSNNSSASVTTDPQGAYTVLLLNGSASAAAQPPAGSPLVATAKSFTLNGDSQEDFTLGTAVAISGVIRGRNGQPVSNAYVRVSAGPSSASTYTDSQGQYTLPAANGTAYLEAYGGGPAGVAPSNFSAERYNIAVNGPTTVDLDLPVVTLTGRVLDPSGNGVAGASLSLSSYKSVTGGYNNSSASVTTDPQGAYTVLLLSGSGSATAQPPAGSPLVATAKSFTLNGDSQEDFTLGAAVAISGVIRGRNGQPVSNAYVRVSAGPSSVSTYTDSQGQYTLQAANATAYLQVYGGGPAGVAPQNFSAERYNIAVNGPTTVDVDLPVFSVTGTVTDSNGAPVPNVTLSAGSYQYVTSGYNNSSANVTTNAQGSYTYLMVAGSGSFQVRPPVATGFLQANVPFSVSSDLTQRIILQRPDLSPPQIVAGPLVVHLSATSISVSWTTNEAATSRVEYGIGGLTSVITDEALTTNHTVTLLNLAAQATHTFRVGSTDASGNGPTYSPEGSFMTQALPGDITAPVITDGPTVVFVDQTSAIVQWTTDEPATSVLALGLTSELGSIVSGPAGKFVLSHSLKVTGLTPETNYVAQVTTADPDGNTTNSSTFTFSTLAVPDTTAPVITAGPSILSETDSKITVVWTTNEPATSGVSYNDGTSFNLVSDAMLTRNHQMTLSGLAPQTNYNITVSSTDAVGNGPTLGGPIQAMTDATPDTTEPVISNLAVSEITQTSAVISWTTDEPANSAISYGMFPGAPDGSRADVGAVTMHRLTLTGLRDGTPYYLTVSSIDASGNLATSAEISLTTVSAFVDMPPTAPGPITAPAGPTNAESFSISWGASIDDVGLVGYEVLRDGAVAATVAPDTTSVIEAAVSEGTHAYQIRATDTFGHTVVSAVVEVTVDRTAPHVDVPSDIVLEAAGTSATVTYTALATDNVDMQVAVSCIPASGSAFPVGETDVTCAATDTAGNSGTASFKVLVQDNTPPHVTAPADQVLEATGPQGAVATFSATATDVVSGTLVPACVPASGSTFPLGTTAVTCTAADAAGNTGSVSFSVMVLDRTAPNIASVTPSQTVLWPPNHQMVGLTLRVNVTDVADAAPSCRIIGVASNEPVNGSGDGDTAPDWSFADGLALSLRAERAGGGAGRIYTITTQCTDAGGNAATKTTAVIVPKSQGR